MDHRTGFVWHLWQSVVGNATVTWHAPQYFPSKISVIEYFVVPFLIPAKISGWHSSQPFHTVCFLWEKMISGIVSTFAPMAKSFWTARAGRLMETPSM